LYLGGDDKLKEKIYKPEIIAVILATVILTTVLMIKPIIGVADNGDFYRVMIPVGLEYLTDDYSEKYFNYIHSKYRVRNVGVWGGGDYITTHIIPVKLAIFLNNLVLFHSGIFDIRFLSVIYSVILLFSLFLITKYTQSRYKPVNWLIMALSVLVFLDVGYISYFNSLYGEAASYVFLLLTVAITIYILKCERPKISVLIAFFIAAIFFVGAKQQNSPLVVLFAAFGIRFLWLRKDWLWKNTVIICTIVLILASGLVYSVISQEIRNINIHQAVFFGILKDSKTPEEDLQELGLDPKLSVLAGKTYYDENVPIKPKSEELKKEFFDKISYTKIVAFYLKHPIRFIQKMEVTANNAFTIRQGYLGNYEKSEQLEPGKQTNLFSLWSYIKQTRIPHHLWFVVLFYIVFYSVWFVEYKKTGTIKERVFLELYALIGISGLIQFVLPMLADGEGDLSKHLFLFSVCFDIMFVTAVVWAVKTALERKQRLKDLYGVTQ